MNSARNKSRNEGSPAWIITFADMMALLLCFFILLQMFSELKRDREYQRVANAVKAAFGFTGQVGILPTEDVPLQSMIQALDTVTAKRDELEPNRSHVVDAGPTGPRTRVRSVPNGLQFTIGGPAMFAPASADLTVEGRQAVLDLAPLLAGRRNRIVIRGHAANKYLPPHAPWRNLDELSFHRAVAVQVVLVEAGIEDRLFRLEAVGTREPINAKAYREAELADHRRVDILLTEDVLEPTMDTGVTRTAANWSTAP
ncbi:MAG: OmpA family protein [Phycisphaerales bacterium]|nr:OmpA family protein [Phycisphaerales bacterium]